MRDLVKHPTPAERAKLLTLTDLRGQLEQGSKLETYFPDSGETVRDIIQLRLLGPVGVLESYLSILRRYGVNRMKGSGRFVDENQ